MSSSQRWPQAAYTGRPASASYSSAITVSPAPCVVVSHWSQANPKPNGSSAAVAIPFWICPRRLASSWARVMARPRDWLPGQGQVELVVGQRAHVVQVQRVGQRLLAVHPGVRPASGVPQVGGCGPDREAARAGCPSGPASWRARASSVAPSIMSSCQLVSG